MEQDNPSGSESGKEWTLWVENGDEYFESEQYEEALLAYEQSARLEPDYARTYQRIGSMLEKLQRPDEAQVAYEQAQRLNQS